MSKISVTFAVIFLSISVISHARTPFNLPANEIIPLTTSSGSETKPSSDLHTIQLLNQKPESDNIIPINDIPESDTSTTALTTIGPFKVTYDVNFRSVNRHFHHMNVNHPLWYRFPHHCGHHHHEKSREISYGNDMIMSDKTTDFNPKFRGDLRKIPTRLSQFRGDRFPVRSLRVNGGGSLTEKMFKKLRHVDDDEKKMKKKGGFVKVNGFMKRVRKFLMNRFQQV